MKRTLIPLAALGAAAVLSASIAPAWAYFTDTSSATGGIRINVEPTTDIEETYGERTKHVTIKNIGDNNVSVYVRARVFASESVDVSGTGWSGPDGEGWYNFDNPVDCGKSANELTVKLTFPEGAIQDDPYNVIVIYESTPVQYQEDGTPYADWSYILDNGTAEGGN